jgi:hypothetical protein
MCGTTRSVGVDGTIARVLDGRGNPEYRGTARRRLPSSTQGHPPETRGTRRRPRDGHLRRRDRRDCRSRSHSLVRRPEKQGSADRTPLSRIARRVSLATVPVIAAVHLRADGQHEGYSRSLYRRTTRVQDGSSVAYRSVERQRRPTAFLTDARWCGDRATGRQRQRCSQGFR